jgi:glycosyltransferase involved in cell wall biosynthesis
MEPYHGGSHRHLAEGLVARLAGSHPIELWTLPARTWKWRMRGAAIHFADRWRREQPLAAGILVTSLLDAAALRGLLPREAAALPFLLYCHENQLNYPVRVDDKRDYHYGWTNIQSVAAADRSYWNSSYNLESFLAELPDFLGRMPDARPTDLPERLRERAELLPVPADLATLIDAERSASTGPPRLLWNHRWEHDKGPAEFFTALAALADEGLPFTLSVLGQRFQETPPEFDRARDTLAERIHCWGFRESREEYHRELLSADIALSTARHEFQGLAMLEAGAAGCSLLVPDDLAYPEIWPADCRYPPGALLPALRERLLDPGSWRGPECRRSAAAFDWARLLPRWAELFAAD